MQHFSSPALPVGGKEATENSTEEFRGDLQKTPIPLVLHRIVESRAKGTLTLSKPGEKVRLYFVDGELKTASTKKRGMRIGEMLILHGVLEEEQIEEALKAIHDGRRGRIGKLLVEKGYLTREVLDSEIRKHFEEIFFSCFLWREGEFEFLASPGTLDPDVALDLPTAALIIEGVRRAPEEDRYEEALGDPEHFGRATGLALRVASLRLNSEEAFLLSLCDGKTRLRDILRLGRSREATGRMLYTLLACGLIEFGPASPRARPSAAVVEEPPDLPGGLSGN